MPWLVFIVLSAAVSFCLTRGALDNRDLVVISVVALIIAAYRRRRSARPLPSRYTRGK
jgi:hypothetical protein